MKPLTITPGGRVVSAKSNPCGSRSKVKRNHPAPSDETFPIHWIGPDSEDFLRGDVLTAYKDEFGTVYGESMRGSWLPIGDEGVNWEWMNYGGRKRAVKKNGFKHARPFGGSVGREQYHVHFEDAKGVIYYFAGNTDRGVKLEREYAKAKKFTPQRAAQLAKRLDRLYKNVRHDGGHFYAESAGDVKANPRDFGADESYRAAEGGYEPTPTSKAVWNDEDRDGFVYGKKFDLGELYDARRDTTRYWGWPTKNSEPIEIDASEFTFGKAKV